MRSYRVCHRESGIAGCDASITQIEHLGPNRYELVRVVDYWVRVGPSRSQEGPTHLFFSVVGQEFCQIPLLVWALSRDILHPCSGQHWQPCMCLCANIRLLYDKQMYH